MRDYWLTQSLLAAVGWGYLLLVLVALVLALLLPKSRKAKAVLAVVVLALASILPIQGYQQHKQQQEVQAVRQDLRAKAKALFDERCKTAGEKVYRTEANVEGVLLSKLRPARVNLADQFALDDPYGRDFGGEQYIAAYLAGRNSDGTFSAKHTRNAFRFVEVPEADGSLYRYVAVPNPTASDGVDLKLVRERVERSNARFKVTWDDISTHEDRLHWIAGSRLQIVEIATGQLIAERIGYMFDVELGNQAGGRSPWAYAEYNACPAFERTPAGYPSKTTRSRGFVLRVLQPAQGD